MENATDVNQTKSSNTANIVNISLQTCIALFGVVGNIFVCVLILMKRRMKLAMNFYLLSLAIADLGILSVNFPIAGTRAFSDKWLLGSFGCVFVFPASELFFGASIWSIQAIAVERYRNIVGSKRFARERSTKYIKIVIPLIWAASFLVSSVPMFIVIKYNAPQKSCVVDWPEGEGWHVAYFVALTVLFYIVPLVLISFTYVCISRALRKSNEFRESSTKRGKATARSHSHQSSGARMRHQNNKAKRILTPLVILFAVSMLPLSTLRIAQFLWGDGVSPRVQNHFFTVAIYGVIINSSLNPLIYCIVSKEFRQGFRDILRSICSKKNYIFRQRSRTTSSRLTKISSEEGVKSPPYGPASLEFISAV